MKRKEIIKEYTLKEKGFDVLCGTLLAIAACIFVRNMLMGVLAALAFVCVLVTGFDIETYAERLQTPVFVLKIQPQAQALARKYKAARMRAGFALRQKARAVRTRRYAPAS